MKTCADCGDKKPGKFHTDPRDPPLEEDECLCHDCCISATMEVIDGMEENLAEHKADLKKLLEKKKR